MPQSRSVRFAVGLAVLLVLVGIAVRLMPHPPNFTPIVAVALFAGVYLPRKYALVIPLAAMVISDAIIGFHNLIFFTWGSFAVVGLMGWWIQKHKSAWSIIGGSLSASVLFYLVTNWAVMQFTPLYPASIEGLFSSYVAALPFFRNMLLGDLFYSGVLFGLYEAVIYATALRDGRVHSHS